MATSTLPVINTPRWTSQDEQQLNNLLQRKKMFDEDRRSTLRELIGDRLALAVSSAQHEDLLNALVEHAGEFIAALAPFDYTK